MSSNFFNKFNQGTSDFVTAGMQLKYIADYKPNDTAIIYIGKDNEEETISWKELHTKSNQLAWHLDDKGIGPGSVVIVSWPNSIEHMIASFAIWKLGACYMPLSNKIAQNELDQISESIDAALAFSEFPIGKQVEYINVETMYESIKAEPEHMPKDIIANPNMVSLTGGTSGKIKLVRQNMPSGISDAIFKIWFQISGMDFEQRQLLLGPLFHGAPHTAAFNGLYSGNTLIIPRNLCQGNIIKLIKEYEVEYMQLVPILMNRIIKTPGIEKEDFASIKAISHTSGYCSNWLKKKWIDLLAPEKIYEIYSMTEIVGLTAIRGDEWLKHEGSVGKPVGLGKISIRDSQGQDVGACQLGEIFMTPPDKSFETEFVSKEREEEKQKQMEKDDFLSVGDFGYIDEDGYLYFVDRRHDMLVTGGENVFVTEIETALLRHDAVLDVIVLGIPDEEWGRRVHAVVETTKELSEEELKEFLQQYLSPYKIPKTFEFVKNLRRMCNGKSDRARILQECMERQQ